MAEEYHSPWRRKWASLKLREKDHVFIFKSSGTSGCGGWRGLLATRHLEDFRTGEQGAGTIRDPRPEVKAHRCDGEGGLCPVMPRLSEAAPSSTTGSLPNEDRTRLSWPRAQQKVSRVCLKECKSITVHVEKDVTDPHSVSQAGEARHMDFVSLDPDHSLSNPFSLYVGPGRTRLN